MFKILSAKSMINSSFFADPTRTHFVRSAHDWVRICRDAVRKRLAQARHFPAASVQIFTVGEIPVRVTPAQSYFPQIKSTLHGSLRSPFSFTFFTNIHLQFSLCSVIMNTTQSPYQYPAQARRTGDANDLRKKHKATQA